MTVTEITSKADYLKQIVQYEGVAILDAYATWCGPCKMISPVLEKMSEDSKYEKAKFFKFDVDAVPDVAQELGIQAMPTFAFFKNGELQDSVRGANPKGIEEALAKTLAL